MAANRESVQREDLRNAPDGTVMSKVAARKTPRHREEPGFPVPFGVKRQSP